MIKNENNKKPVTLRLQLHLTEKCNWRCRHCYGNTNYENGEMGTKETIAVIRDFIKLGDELSIPFPLLGIAFTGGEPLLRKDLPDLLKEMEKHKNRIIFSLYTNGSLLTEELLVKLKKEAGVKSIQLSIEGNRETNDKIRGKGTYDLIKEKIKLIRKHDINAQLSLTITKMNAKDIPALIADFRPYNIRFNIRRFVPIGRGKKIKDFLLEPLEIKKLYDYIERKKNAYPPINIYRGCEEGIFSPWTDKKNSLNHCGLFDKRIIVVMPNGDVLPCRRLPVLLGNVKNAGLRKIYMKSDIYNLIRRKKTNNENCRNCEFFDNCGGGARCVAYAYFNNGLFDNPDPQCAGLFKKLP